MRIYSLLASRGCHSFCCVVSYAKQVKLLSLGLSLLKLPSLQPSILRTEKDRQRSEQILAAVGGGQELCSCFAGLFLVVPFVNFNKVAAE